MFILKPEKTGPKDRGCKSVQVSLECPSAGLEGLYLGAVKGSPFQFPPSCSVVMIQVEKPYQSTEDHPLLCPFGLLRV